MVPFSFFFSQVDSLWILLKLALNFLQFRLDQLLNSSISYLDFQKLFSRFLWLLSTVLQNLQVLSSRYELQDLKLKSSLELKLGFRMGALDIVKGLSLEEFNK